MRRQCGATLTLTVVTLTALLGAAALAVDVGLLYGARRRAQDTADAAALAGGPLLPNVMQATAAANAIIGANNAASVTFVVKGITSPASVTQDDGTTAAVGAGNALVVQGYVDAPLAFGPVVGFQPSSQTGQANTFSVSAQAAVVLQNACGLPPGVGVAPFAVVGDDPNSPDTTAQYAAALLSTATNAQTPSANTYQSVTTSGGQAIVLRQNVWSNGTRVFAGNFDPVQFGGQGYASSINNTSGVALSDGQILSTQANATITLTQQYLGARLSPSNTQFRHDYTTYTDWFFGGHALPVDTSQPPVTDSNTGQTYSYHVDPHRQELTDAHVLIVPVVSQSVRNGTGPVTILAFAAFFVEQSYVNKNNNAIAQGRFVGLTLPSASGGACTGAGDRTSPRLVR